MNGKMRRLSLTLLAVLLCLGALAGCGGGSSVLNLPDGTAVPGNQPKETPAPLTPLGDRTCYVGKETIPESTLFSFILTEETFDPLMGLTLMFKSTNKSNTRNIVVSLNCLSVNGYMQDSGYEAQVPAGQTVLGEILIPISALRSAGVSSVEELILYPLIYDPNVPMGQGDVVDGAFSFYPTGQTKGTVVYPVRQKTTTEQTFFDNGFGTIIILSAAANEQGQLEVDCYLENKTDRFLSFSWSDVTVNNVPLTYADDAVVAPYMRRYVTMSLFGVPENASEVAFKVSATTLSNIGTDFSPLLQQQGSYRFANVGTSAETDPAGGVSAIASPAGTAIPAPTAVVYTFPTSTQKKNATDGYVKKDGVNMRSGPGTSYRPVGEKINEYTAVTLYELQDGWWFLKCGSKYGYIRSDLLAQGKAPKAVAPNRDQKKNAQDGYVKKDDVNMRTGPGTSYKIVGERIEQNTAVTLYELEDGWWFLKCGTEYGYIRADLIAQGKAPETISAAPESTPESTSEGTLEGTVRVQSIAALREKPDTEARCLKELSNDDKVTVYYKITGNDGKTWYYVAYGSTTGYIRANLVKVSGNVPSK